jgi:hypothetical protein
MWSALAAAVVVSLVEVTDGQPTEARQTPVTFTADVAPILYRHCVACHRDGEMAPMPLTSFREVRPWARAIRTAVVAKDMPPWGATSDAGAIANDPSLSVSEIDTIVRWVNAGAPEGDSRALPQLPSADSRWKMGTPDLVLSMAESFEIAAEPRSVYGDFPLRTSFTEDKYICAAEVQPGNRDVTHHANVYVNDDNGSHRIASFSPGTGAKTYPPGVAKLLPAGAVLNLDMHYNPKGRAGRDPGTTVALKFASEPVRQIAITAQSGNNTIDIPPGEADYELTGKPFAFAEDSHILSFTPRMNERGKRFHYELVTPDGRRTLLLSVYKWRYDWVFTYVLDAPVAAPKGSRIETHAVWDNSAANKANPDPAARVKFGPEIMNGYFEYVVDSQNLSEKP